MFFKKQKIIYIYIISVINNLAQKPEFYHLLGSNCTINISKYANCIGAVSEFDLKIIVKWI